jgi:hypothetical protein
MCFFSAYERFRFHVPLFVTAILLTICAAILICYGASRDIIELWVAGIVVGAFTVIIFLYAFFVLCILYNPKSPYVKRNQYRAASALPTPRIYNPYARSVVSYPSAMQVQPPSVVMMQQGNQQPPNGQTTPKMGSYQPLSNGSDVASSPLAYHETVYQLNAQTVSPPTSDIYSEIYQEGSNTEYAMLNRPRPNVLSSPSDLSQQASLSINVKMSKPSLGQRI